MPRITVRNKSQFTSRFRLQPGPLFFVVLFSLLRQSPVVQFRRALNSAQSSGQTLAHGSPPASAPKCWDRAFILDPWAIPTTQLLAKQPSQLAQALATRPRSTPFSLTICNISPPSSYFMVYNPPTNATSISDFSLNLPTSAPNKVPLQACNSHETERRRNFSQEDPSCN